MLQGWRLWSGEHYKPISVYSLYFPTHVNILYNRRLLIEKKKKKQTFAARDRTSRFYIAAKLCVPIDAQRIAPAVTSNNFVTWKRGEVAPVSFNPINARTPRLFAGYLLDCAPPGFRLPPPPSPLFPYRPLSFTLISARPAARDTRNRRPEVYVLIAVFTYNPKGLPLRGSLLNSEANTLS